MQSTLGYSWYAVEGQPNGWYTSTYNAILQSSLPAPQVYSNSMANAVNSECTTYSVCTNIVTVDSQLGSPWNSANYVNGLISGAPYQLWGANNWWNKWRPE